MNWRNIIKETMSYKGISAADIERQTNISKGLLSNYFAGRTNMSTSNIEQILDILNINLPFHKKNIPEERYEENDFNHFLIDIQEREVLNDTQKGVIRQTLAKGYNSLTDKQKKMNFSITEISKKRLFMELSNRIMLKSVNFAWIELNGMIC